MDLGYRRFSRLRRTNKNEHGMEGGRKEGSELVYEHLRRLLFSVQRSVFEFSFSSSL